MTLPILSANATHDPWPTEWTAAFDCTWRRKNRNPARSCRMIPHNRGFKTGRRRPIDNTFRAYFLTSRDVLSAGSLGDFCHAMATINTVVGHNCGEHPLIRTLGRPHGRLFTQFLSSNPKSLIGVETPSQWDYSMFQCP